jgi:N12 class adenine-specific DNA methylase
LATKLQMMNELSEATGRAIAQTPGNWTSFLNTAALNYKYSFWEQILIYAQRPDATACAEISVWNKLGRWVNVGAHGIALIDDSGTRQRLRHVFDVSDTNDRRNHVVLLWQMSEKDAGEVTEALENAFGELSDKTGIAAAIFSAARNAVEDNFADYLAELKEFRQDSFLEELDELNVEVVFRKILTASVGYVALTRCGLDAGDFFAPDDFRGIVNFNTIDTVSRLGMATSDISEMLLREIGSTVRAVQRAEKEHGRTLAKSREPAHNDGSKQNEQGDETYGTDLHTARGLSAAGSYAAGAGDHVRKIWDVAQNISQGAPQGNVRQSDDAGQAEQPLGGDRPDGEGARGTNRVAASADRPGPGQSGQSDGLGAAHEQPERSGGGNRVGGADLQLKWHDRETEGRSLPFFHDTDAINDILRESPRLKASRQEIAAYFASHEDEGERTAYIQSIFNSDSTRVVLSDGRVFGYEPYQNVLYLWAGEPDAKTEQSFYDWHVIAGHFSGMMALGEYLDESPELPTQQEQMTLIQKAEDEKSSAFLIPQAAVDAVLQQGSHVQDGKYRIYEQFQKNATAKENADFLKNEYGTGGRGPALTGTDLDEMHDSKGIRITRGPLTHPNAQILLPWMKVQKRIGELIAANRYFNAKEKEHFPVYEQETRERRQRAAEADYARKILSREPEKPAEPDRQHAHYALTLGASVYLGADEYEIVSLGGDKVTMRNAKFPLFTKELEHADFDRMLRETPLNDHMIAEGAEEPAGKEASASPLELYRRYLPELTDRVRRDEVYAVLRDRDIDTETAKRALDEAFDRIVLSMKDEHPDFYSACSDQPQFREWLAEDVFQSTYQDVLTEPRDSVTLHANDPDAPEWVKKAGDVTLTREGDTVTIDRVDRAEGKTASYVEMDVSLPEDSKAENPVEEEITAGTEFSLENRRYTVDSIDTEAGTVSLKDITFQGGTGFPIFRRESVDFVRNVLDLQTEPIWEKTAGGEVSKIRIDLSPKEPEPPRVNFHITDDNLGVGGAKAKYGWNIAAIKLLNQLEMENRLATPEEQEILCRYVGWGGLPQVFDEKNGQWATEYAELKMLLDPDEYESANGSTLNAHYTSPVVIKAIYSCLENMGFKTGNVLEPACGIGNFFGLVPESMRGSKLYGIELDPVTGRIAKQLYQNANITVEGFEDTNLPDSFFDLSIGNVPFGGYGVADKKYDRYHFQIHDFFFAKAIDKTRPGGLIVFITSKGTLDKKNPEVRKYIAQRAELLGAVRLPNTAFLANAGTEVTTDIIFLQKRDRMIDAEPEWVHLGETEDNVTVNQYFLDHPDMMLGTMAYSKRMYGNETETTCNPFEGGNLVEQLGEAMENIHAEFSELEPDELAEKEDASIPADPNVRNFSFTVVDSKLYYRENSVMNPADTSATGRSRITGMIAIRDCVRELIEMETEDYSDDAIVLQQKKLNRLYDSFTAKYGLLSSRGNNMAFADDSSYSLLCSLEVVDEDGNLERKADMFSKRTIRQRIQITHADTAVEALGISIGEKACVDMKFMQNLTGMSEEQLAADLKGVIFRDLGDQDPATVPKAFVKLESYPYVTSDAYLSGNVRNKLKLARALAEMRPDLAPEIEENIRALEKVQPKDLSASEIDVRLGATWLPPKVVRDFIFDLLDTPPMYRRYIDVMYSNYTANWNVKGKSDDRSDNIRANVTYGTKRINAYKIIEETLNLRDVRIFDTKYEDGNEVRVLNKQQTAIAQQKQEAIKEAFKSWIWKDPSQRERLTRIYNDRFNSIRPREYDGSHIRFTGMNPEKHLRKHQVDAVAHVLYGGNTLLAHCVGAGKTYEMVASAMEGRHLGLCSKSMFVVPNHIIDQWAASFLELYPSANILVATKKDFETKNRKKFCARIATGDFDAVIIGHSQFEKIPISQERQKRQLQEQIWEITNGIQELKEAKGERYAVKQLARTKKMLEAKLKKINDTSRKDDVVTFEELGVDRLFVDESDFYKNLFIYTKMRNVAGLSQTEAQKSSDMFAKCRYLDELTEGRGVVFATGTPISNSVTELYTIQRYLQYKLLQEKGLQHFDAWASSFGETVTAIELAPEGTGYRAKTRFARFYNLPELMNMFKEVADIKTADMLDLPIPKAHYENVAVKPSEFQKDMVAELAQRAEDIRQKKVEPTVDNMLRVTNDGRKLALDQRLANPMLPDFEGSKVNACVEKVFEFWEKGRNKRLTQLVFSDLSIPKGDGSFNVYDDIKTKLIAKGVPAEEVMFIHDANTEAKKKELFAKVCRGQVRILIGSTFKMGAGTNVQDLLIASHDLDCPWRPRDLEQRAGRTIRQGNKNPDVYIIRYVTENTFDAYLYQILENKQKFISQIMTSKSPVRSAEDIDEAALSYAEVKALATGNPYIKQKMDLDIQVSRLKLLKANHLSQRYALEDRVLKTYPEEINYFEERITAYEKDIATWQAHKPPKKDGEDIPFPGMTVQGLTYTDKAKAGTAILEVCKAMTKPEPQEIGGYMGFTLLLSFDTFAKQYEMTLRGALSNNVRLGTDVHGNITRLNNVLEAIPKELEYNKEKLAETMNQMEKAKAEIDVPFEQEEELAQKSARLAELNVLLNMDKHENEVVDEEPDEEVGELVRTSAGMER